MGQEITLHQLKPNRKKNLKELSEILFSKGMAKVNLIGPTLVIVPIPIYISFFIFEKTLFTLLLQLPKSKPGKT